MDPAFLRRIAYKVQVHQPTEEHYRRVFRMLCEKHKVPFDDSVANFAMDKIQNVLNQPLSFYQPRFIVEQIIAACKYEGAPPRMDVELLIDALGQHLLGRRPHRTGHDGAPDRQLGRCRRPSERRLPLAARAAVPS